MPKTPLGAHFTRWQERRERQERYWAALGEFVDNFAKTEATLQMALWAISGTNALGRALFSGARVDQAVSFINRILETNSDAKGKANLSTYFVQLGILTRTRNDLLHYGSYMEMDGERARVTNVTAAHIEAKFKETFISPKDLIDMSRDLRQIMRALQALAFDGVRPADLDKALDMMREPWRYKPPPTASPDGMIRTIRPKQSPRPTSSQE